MAFTDLMKNFKGKDKNSGIKGEQEPLQKINLKKKKAGINTKPSKKFMMNKKLMTN